MGKKSTLSFLPLRGMVLFPNNGAHIDIGRDKSVAALEECLAHGRQIMLSAQKDVEVEDPKREDVYEIGTVCQVQHVTKLNNGIMRAQIEGLYRARILDFRDDGLFIEVDVEESIPRVVDLEHVLYAAAKIGAAHVEATCRSVERGEELAQPEADFGCPKSERGLRVDAELNGVDVPDVFALGEQDVRTAGIGLVHQGVIVLHGGVVRREGEPSPRCEERDVLHLLRAERGVARAVGEAVFVGQLVAQV